MLQQKQSTGTIPQVKLTIMKKNYHAFKALCFSRSICKNSKLQLAPEVRTEKWNRLLSDGCFKPAEVNFDFILFNEDVISV
jgi:hypothetical protein